MDVHKLHLSEKHVEKIKYEYIYLETVYMANPPLEVSPSIIHLHNIIVIEIPKYGVDALVTVSDEETQDRLTERYGCT